MDKTAAIAGLILVLTGTAGASQFNVKVQTQINVEHFGTEAYDNASALQRINLTAENFGSANCLHSLRAEIAAGDTRYTRYSKPRELESGKSVNHMMMLAPLNHTGQVRLNLSAAYCDRTRPVTEISYNQTQELITERTLNSTTVESTEDSVEFEVEGLENATLVPVDHPPVWKVGSTTLRHGQAQLGFEPTVFHPSRNITFAAFKNGDVVARTKVSLREPETPMQGIRKLLPGSNVATVSLLLNIILTAVLVHAHRQSLKRALAKLR